MDSRCYTRCLLELSWPLANIGPNLPNLMDTVAGNLFELRQVSGLRILDLKLPKAFAGVYPGPAFGVAGTRELRWCPRRCHHRHHHQAQCWPERRRDAQQVQMLVDGGIDFIKDDELQADGSYCPFRERVAAVMDVVTGLPKRRAAKRWWPSTLRVSLIR